MSSSFLLPFACFAQVKSEDYQLYNGNDLGVTYTPAKTVFKIWAPTASAVKVRLYSSGAGGQAYSTLPMSKALQGVWTTAITRDIRNAYYTFQVQQKGEWLAETPGIYAQAVGVKGKRGMVVNLPATNPVNWTNDKEPLQKNFTDIII